MPASTNRFKEIDLRSERGLARAISLVENDEAGYTDWLAGLQIPSDVPVIGITGPPGAGKSTVVNSLISYYVSQNERIGVLAVDPTSPFNFGSLLGDRIRMAGHFNDDRIFIRSLATRGSLGGLSAKTLDIVELMRAAGFDRIFVETVGVGQSEVEIAGLADTTVVVLVPEAGDEIQNLKSGIMEIADIFVVNKSDREGAKQFAANLKKIVHGRPKGDWQIPVIPTVATQDDGMGNLAKAIDEHNKHPHNLHMRSQLLAEKAYQLIANQRMRDLSKAGLVSEVEANLKKGHFNLHRFVSDFRRS